MRNYIDQSQEFALCAIALVYPIVTLVQQGRVRIAALFAVLALGFLANMMFVVVSRTALVTLPVLLVVFALLHLRWRAALVAGAATALIAVALWAVSPHLRATVGKFQSDNERSLEADNNSISGMGSRLEYWRKSLRFIADAPLIGHGTGSIRGLFAGVAANPTTTRCAARSSATRTIRPSECRAVGRRRRAGPLRAVDRAPSDVSRRGAGLLDRHAGRGAEHAVLTAQHASVRFHLGLDLRARCRRRRRHGARGEEDAI